VRSRKEALQCPTTQGKEGNDITCHLDSKDSKERQGTHKERQGRPPPPIVAGMKMETEWLNTLFLLKSQISDIDKVIDLC
jgi:hypothetical protein